MKQSHRKVIQNRNYRRWFDQSRPSFIRHGMRIQAALCDRISTMLVEVGVDPARCAMLRRGEEAAATLAAIPDTPELRRFDEELLAQDPLRGDDEPPPVFERDMANLHRMAQRFADGAEPDFAECSLMEAYAFCVARLNREAGDPTGPANGAPAAVDPEHAAAGAHTA